MLIHIIELSMPFGVDNKSWYISILFHHKDWESLHFTPPLRVGVGVLISTLYDYLFSKSSFENSVDPNLFISIH